MNMIRRMKSDALLRNSAREWVGAWRLVLLLCLLGGMPAQQQGLAVELAAQKEAEARAEQEKARIEQERAREQKPAEPERAPKQKEPARLHEKRGRWEQERARSGQDRIYEYGMRALENRQWDKAIELLNQVAQRGERRADGALYWKAYAQNKQGRRAEALATLEELRKSHPSSRWLNDAKVLEAEIRQASGQPVSPESEMDDELKLLAINSLMHSDADRVIPLLEKLLQGNHPPKLKERALFVLAQNRSPRAREVVAQVARGKGNPDLQMRAVQHLGMFGGKESRQLLAEIYAGSGDVDVKRTILQSFMMAGERDRVLAVAREEKDPKLRGQAVQHLGMMGAQAELWQLYQAESSLEVKRNIVMAVFMGGNPEKLIEIARTEKDPQLRREAIHRLGLMRGKQTGDALAAIYAGEKEPAIRKEVIHALFLQGNAAALVGIARKETDPALKKDVVHRLSLMKSKEATDFLLELLNK